MLAGVTRNSAARDCLGTLTRGRSDANAPALRVTVSGITNSSTIIRAVSANSTS
jgi:hypothetical protein